MPPRSALLIFTLALCAGVIYLFYKLAFGSTVSFWESIVLYWREKKDAFYNAKRRQLDEELQVEKKKEVCSRRKKVAIIDGYVPARVARMYDRLCRQCVFELTVSERKVGKK